MRGTATRLFAVEKCAKCGLAFATPRPSEPELAEFYSGEYFKGSAAYTDYCGRSWAAANAERMWRLICQWQPNLKDVQPRRLLDVGCAFGHFAASVANEGWEVRGVEVSEDARSHAAAKGVEVYETLSDAPSDNGLITMFHVLEHVLEPSATLREARRLIAPAGRLVVELPQWHSLGRMVKRGKWGAFTPPEHLNFFDKRSLGTALADAGWLPIRMSTLHTTGSDQTVEALERRRWVRFAIVASQTAVLEATGLAGYLRVVAKPTEPPGQVPRW